MNASVKVALANLHTSFSQLNIQYDADLRTVFSWMRPVPRPCFTGTMLEEIKTCDSLIESNGGYVDSVGRVQQVDYAVYGSAIPGVFNLGGDLDTFVQAISRHDRQFLAHYAKICVDNQLRRHRGLGGRVTTIALVQGKALGGGFECALACNVIVAERSATMSLPETLFNLFPGMGALSFLGRKIGLRKAEELITSGATYTAKELYDIGVVDELVEDGLGLPSVRQLILYRHKRQNTYRSLCMARVHYQPITDAEMMGIVDAWVDGALRLSEKDLRMMSRLVRAQDRMIGSHQEDQFSNDIQTARTLQAA